MFVASGAVGIQYEVLWLRVFTHVTGSSIQSVSAVVTAFLLGLALGGALLGRRVDRGGGALRLYGALEVGVGLLHLAAFGAFSGFDGPYARLHGVVPYAALQWLLFALAALFVTIPATLLGGTIPVLVKHVVERRGGDAAREAGLLYALNTLGAAFGALLLAHTCLPALGYGGSIVAASLASVGLGATALLLARSAGEAPAAAPPDADPAPAPTGGAAPGTWAVLAGYAASGFACLGYEVVWSRQLEHLFKGTLESFAYLLLLFLFGLALGNLLGIAVERRAAARLDGRVLLGALLVLAGACALGSLVALWLGGIGPAFLASILLITALSGATFPIAVRLSFRGVPVFGRTVGDLYSVNTAGSIAGTCAAGFLLVPLVGSQLTLALLAALHLAAGVAVLARPRPRLAAGLGAASAAVVAALVALVPADAVVRAGYRGERAGELVASTESALGIVAVLEDEHGGRTLYGGPSVSGSTSRRFVQLVQGHLAMLVHPRPETVLEIGYGVGDILRALRCHGPDVVDLVEIDPAMIPMADAHFERVNARASRAPGVRTTIMDGRHFLAMTDRRWDVIMSDTFFPYSAASTRLYTLEHVRNGARHLAPGGVMVIWLPLNVGFERAATLLATFRAVFPHVLVWWEAQNLFVIGKLEPFELSLAELARRFEAASRADLRLIGFETVDDLLLDFCLDEGGLARALGEGRRPHRDLDPVFDFTPSGVFEPDHPLIAALRAGSPRALLPHLGRTAPAERAAFEAEVARFEEADRAFREVSRRVTPHVDWRASATAEVARAALTDLEALLDRAPHHRRARVLHESVGLSLASALPRGDPAVLAVLRQVLARSPESMAANLRAGLELLHAGDPAAARRHLERARAVQPYVRPDPEGL